MLQGALMSLEPSAWRLTYGVSTLVVMLLDELTCSRVNLLRLRVGGQVLLQAASQVVAAHSE
jgi:hypothetical protein